MSLLISLAIAALAVGLYWPARSYPFLFSENYIVQIARSYSVPKTVAARWFEWNHRHRRLTWITYERDFKRYGTADPTGWRRTNIGLHAIASVLTYLFIEQLGAGPFFSALAGGIFAASPINSAAVCSLTARATLLCSVFYLAALTAFLAGEWIPAIAAGYLAWKAKEEAVTLPIVAAVLWWGYR